MLKWVSVRSEALGYDLNQGQFGNMKWYAIIEFQNNLLEWLWESTELFTFSILGPWHLKYDVVTSHYTRGGYHIQILREKLTHFKKRMKSIRSQL